MPPLPPPPPPSWPPPPPPPPSWPPPPPPWPPPPPPPDSPPPPPPDSPPPAPPCPPCSQSVLDICDPPSRGSVARDLPFGFTRKTLSTLGTWIRYATPGTARQSRCVSPSPTSATSVARHACRRRASSGSAATRASPSKR